MKPNIPDRSTWATGWIAIDDENHMLFCIREDGTVVGTCDTRQSPEIVKRWIVKVGEFKQVNITNRQKFIAFWNEKMVDDDDDKYR